MATCVAYWATTHASFRNKLLLRCTFRPQKRAATSARTGTLGRAGCRDGGDKAPRSGKKLGRNFESYEGPLSSIACRRRRAAERIPHWRRLRGSHAPVKRARRKAASAPGRKHETRVLAEDMKPELRDNVTNYGLEIT